MRIAVIVGAVAVGARVAVQLALGFYTAPEAFEYDFIARNIVAGHGYVFDHDGTTYQAFAEPLFTLVLAIAYSIFGLTSITAGAVLLLTGLGQSLLAAMLGRRIGGPAVSLFAGLATALHPGLLAYSARVHALALDGAIVIAAALALDAFADRADLRRGIALGLVAGVAGLERATIVPIIAVAVPLLAWRSRNRAAMLRPALLAAIVASALVAPWIVRNDILLGEPLLTSTGSEVLWYGNNPNASGGAVTAEGVPMLDASPAMHDAVWGKTEIEQDRIFSRAALTYIAEDPWRTVAADAGKLVAFWWFTSRSGLLYPRGWLVPYELYYVGVLAFAGVGAAGLLRDRSQSLFCPVAVAVGVSLVQAVFYVEGRHRWEVEPLLLVLAADGAWRLAARLIAWTARPSSR